MKQIKVSDLEREQLAEWAARAQEWVKCNPYGTMTDAWCASGGEIIFYEQDYCPDIIGEQAMELAKKFNLLVEFGRGKAWYKKGELYIEIIGSTDEIAITRAAIASVYGETVTVEDK